MIFINNTSQYLEKTFTLKNIFFENVCTYMYWIFKENVYLLVTTHDIFRRKKIETFLKVDPYGSASSS